MNVQVRKSSRGFLAALALAGSSLLAISSASAETYIWQNSNVDNTTPKTLDWFSGGLNTQGTWSTTPGAQGSSLITNADTVQFFAGTGVSSTLPNTVAVVQNSVVNNGGTAVQLGTLTLSGRTGGNGAMTMNLSGDALNFSAATGTINLDALTISGSNIFTYNVGNTIQLGTASAASTLTLTGNGTNIGNVTNFNFTGDITELQTGGGSKLIKSGSSIANISGAVTVSGGLQLDAGTLNITGSSNAITGGFTLNGGTLRYTNAITNNNNITVNGTASFLQASGATSTNATITLNTGSNLTLGAQATSQTITGAVTGAGSLTVNRNGGASSTINLNNTANTFTGDITFFNIGSTLTLNVNSLVDSVGAGNIRYTGTNFTGGIASYLFNLGSGAVAPLTLNNRQIEFTSTNTVGGVIGNNSSQAFTINTDLLVSSTTNPILYLGGTGSGLTSFNGLIANGTAASVALTKRDSGTWVIGNSANTYTGATSIQAGTLSVGKLADFNANSSIGAASSGAIILGAGNLSGTLLYTGGGDETNRTIQINTTANTNTGGGTIINNGTGTLTFTAATFNQAYVNASTVTRNLALGGSNNGVIEGVIQNNSATNNISLSKSGTGTWKLSGANTYTGTTSVGTNGGTLQFGKASSLYNGNAASWTAGNIRVASGGTLAFNVGGVDEFTSSDITTLFTNLANSTNATTNGMAAGSRFGFDTSNASGGSFEILQVVANSGGSAGGSRGLTKLGTGTLVLSNTNTYNGSTNVNAGTLAISGTGSINTTSAINVAAGARFANNSSVALTLAPTLSGNGTGSRAVYGGTGTLNAALTLDNVGDVLSPGNSPGIQTFGVDQSWASNSYDWELNDWTASVAGTNIDQINITGNLTLTGATPGSYILNVISLTSGNVTGDVPNFSDVDNSWTILTTTTGISGFDASYWTINTGNFTSSPTATGTWSIAQSGNNLILNYVAVPEPATIALLASGIAIGGYHLARRRRGS